MANAVADRVYEELTESRHSMVVFDRGRAETRLRPANENERVEPEKDGGGELLSCVLLGGTLLPAITPASVATGNYLGDVVQQKVDGLLVSQGKLSGIFK